MTRRIPILNYNDGLSPKKRQVYKSLVEGVSEAIKENKDQFYYNNQIVLTEYSKHIINYIKEHDKKYGSNG